MKINLKLFASLTAYSPEKGLSGSRFQVDLPEGATLLDLTRQLDIPDTEVKISFVNNTIRESDWILHENDEVGIFPPVGGG